MNCKTDRGQKSPILLPKCQALIEKVIIEKLVTEKLENTDIFIVDVTISNDNNICVVLDSDTSISIDSCIEVSKYIESNLDREAEDFSLDVTSSGLSLPIKLPRQYKKNIGKEVEILLKSGVKEKGILVSSDETSFTLQTSKKVKIEGSKKKETITEDIKYSLDEIKSTKIVVNFK